MTKIKNGQSQIGLFSFFAGAGFLDLGFEAFKEYETIFVNEYHQPFMDIYKYSRKEMKIREPQFGYSNEDICAFLKNDKSKELTNLINLARKKFKFIGFIGGPPCPDFSVGGKNKGIKGENGKLSETYIDLIISNQPDFFLFENVKGLYRTKKHKAFFNEIKSRLINHGYIITEKLVNALEYGAPQDRERIILIGFKKDILLKSRLKTYDSNTLNFLDWNSNATYQVQDIFSKEWPKQETFKENSEKPPPNGIYINLTVQHWFERNKVENHPNSKHYFTPRAGLPRFKSICEGDDLKKSFKRLHRWRYSPTAAYGNNEVHLHPYKARRISAAEALAIQSLPKDFIIPSHISLTNMFKTIGNGVPYLMAKGLAETILQFIRKIETKEKTYAEINSQ
ncbi:DNA cytosine methyltransferase [Aegicerativicinus sediminis]|uniref:DNA cytosine methyltransferase n=1 Tax=Aegicerativicinus sediminis TaxID=2893202 RepID=UPI001E45C21D|nr:DNA cytosine methyltransferase [Aegicerativicinus sediminis]